MPANRPCVREYDRISAFICAATDAQMKAEILSYSRTQGLFAGINLSGGIVRAAADDNEDLYGAAVAAKDVVLGTGMRAPAAADAFMAALESAI